MLVLTTSSLLKTMFLAEAFEQNVAPSLKFCEY